MKCIDFRISVEDTVYQEEHIRTSSGFNYICDISNVYEYDDDEQYSMIEKLYNTKEFKNKLSLVKDIKTKIGSYAQQDKLKHLFTCNDFVTFKNVVDLLYNSNLCCYYCEKKVKVVYKYKRMPDQWTLDRIDNTKGHIINNVVISCLQCNLKRRCLNSEKYLFTKTLKIIKTGHLC